MMIGMKSRSRIGSKGQVVIPKEIREKASLRAGSDVVFDLRDSEVIIRRANPPGKDYTQYFISTYSQKLKRKVDIKRLLGEESFERTTTERSIS